MKILIDMNLSPTWVAAFLVAEIESVHWSTVGDQATADRLIMVKVHGGRKEEEKLVL
jgi:predicted nuclease of predicted toxin-antitoxin system